MEEVLRAEREKRKRCVFTVHRVLAGLWDWQRLVGICEEQHLKAQPGVLRCSEGVIGRLLFLSPPILSFPESFQAPGPRTLSSFLIPLRALTCMTGTRERREIAEVQGEEEERETWKGVNKGEK